MSNATLHDVDSIDIFIVIGKKGHKLLLSKEQKQALRAYLEIITRDDKELLATEEVYYEVSV